MAFQQMLRSILDHTRGPIAYDCGLYIDSDAEDDGDAMVQQRLPIPGSPGYCKARAGNGWVRAAGTAARSGSAGAPVDTIAAADSPSDPCRRDKRVSEFDDAASERSQHDTTDSICSSAAADCARVAVCMQPDSTLALASPSSTGCLAAATAVDAGWRGTARPTPRGRRSLAMQM